jgi:hypothetical protein
VLLAAAAVFAKAVAGCERGASESGAAAAFFVLI